MFRSIRRIDADEARLAEFDDRAHLEAAAAPGFVHYFKGPAASDRHVPVVLHVDEPRRGARPLPGDRPTSQAMTLLDEMYERYTLEFLRVRQGRRRLAADVLEPYDRRRVGRRRSPAPIGARLVRTGRRIAGGIGARPEPPHRPRSRSRLEPDAQPQRGDDAADRRHAAGSSRGPAAPSRTPRRGSTPKLARDRRPPSARTSRGSPGRTARSSRGPRRCDSSAAWVTVSSMPRPARRRGTSRSSRPGDRAEDQRSDERRGLGRRPPGRRAAVAPSSSDPRAALDHRRRPGRRPGSRWHGDRHASPTMQQRRRTPPRAGPRVDMHAAHAEHDHRQRRQPDHDDGVDDPLDDDRAEHGRAADALALARGRGCARARRAGRQDVVGEVAEVRVPEHPRVAHALDRVEAARASAPPATPTSSDDRHDHRADDPARVRPGRRTSIACARRRPTAAGSRPRRR